jgi:outer membrane protein assembly factor BamB
MPGNPVIKNCLISDNMTTNSDGYGGGIWMSYDTASVIEACKILNNKSVMGAGLCVGPQGSSTGSTIITSSEITGNMASSQGGGIWTGTNIPFEISDSIISANFAQDDGGFHIQGNNSFKANRCTISGNSGGGIDFLGGRAVLTNCILWGNLRPGDTITNAQIIPPWYPESPIEIRNSCIQDDDANDANIPFGGADYGNIDDDPIFVNPDANDYHLRKDSPCIDAGEPFYEGWNKVRDIDGELRVMGFAFDMGADEYGKMIVVTRPAEGEVWATESWHQIKWDKFGVGSVDIVLSTDGGITWEAIAEDIPDANSYLWQLPSDMDSNQCIISVVPSVMDANVLVYESKLFTIRWYPTRPAVPPQWLRKGLLPAQESSTNKGPEIGCVKWVFETDGPVSSQVAVTRPYWDSYWIYIGSEDGNIYALDDFGEFMWSYDINTPIVGSPAVGYYWMVYVAGQNGWLYAFDEFGDISWTYKTNSPIYSTPVVGYDGKIYVCTEDGLIYALDADGSELWTFATKGPANLSGAIFATPAIDKNGTVYIGGLYEPNLYALDANYGTVKWVCNFSAGIDPCESSSGQIFASPAIGPDGTIYQTLIGDPNLYAIDPCTGNILWKTQLRPDPCYVSQTFSWDCSVRIDRYLSAFRNHTLASSSDYNHYLTDCDEGRWQGVSAHWWMNYLNSSGWSSPVVGSDGTIYVSFDDPYLRAVEPNGTIKWITRLGTVGGFTLTIDNNNLIYAASDDNFVCVIEPNGREISRFEGNNWVSFPAIAEDGTLIVSDANNRVWALSNQDCYFQPAALHRPQDVDSGWSVNFMDFAAMANSWLDCTDPYNSPLCQAGIGKYGLYSPADVDRDQYVDTWDLAEMVDKWLLETADSQSWSQNDWQDWPHIHGPALIPPSW